MVRLLKIMSLSVFFLGSLKTSIVHSEESSLPEYEVKAAFLFNFLKFVNWPPKAFSNANVPIAIGILGRDPFEGTLERIIQGKTINNRKLLVKHSSKIEDLAGCQLLFLSRSVKISEVLDGIQGLSILTVSDQEQASQKGCIIDFFLREGKVGFTINLEAADRAGLRISSKLLKVARINKGG